MFGGTYTIYYHVRRSSHSTRTRSKCYSMDFAVFFLTRAYTEQREFIIWRHTTVTCVWRFIINHSFINLRFPWHRKRYFCFSVHRAGGESIGIPGIDKLIVRVWLCMISQVLRADRPWTAENRLRSVKGPFIKLLSVVYINVGLLYLKFSKYEKSFEVFITMVVIVLFFSWSQRSEVCR